jgi:hypothetical protein
MSSNLIFATDHGLSKLAFETREIIFLYQSRFLANKTNL